MTDKQEHDDHKSMIDKVEEATGGMHKGAQPAGHDREGNFDGIQDAKQAESG